MIDLIQTQRYYHIVALKGTKSIIDKGFYKQWKISPPKKVFDINDCIVSKMSLESDYPYYRGESDYSLNGNKQPPYIFDIILIEYTKLGIFILCFPFKKLAVDLVGSLVSDFNIRKNSNFIKADLTKFVHSNEDETDIYFNKNYFFLGGIFLSIKGDSFLSTVKLVGDKPLESDIYKTYFKNRIKQFGVEKVIVKCKTSESYNKVSSSIHIDKFGNYRLYVQNQGKNIFGIIATFELLSNFDCLLETPNNPTTLIQDEQ